MSNAKEAKLSSELGKNHLFALLCVNFALFAVRVSFRLSKANFHVTKSYYVALFNLPSFSV